MGCQNGCHVTLFLTPPKTQPTETVIAFHTSLRMLKAVFHFQDQTLDVCTSMRMCACVCVRVCVCAWGCVSVCVCASVCELVRAFTYIYIYIYIYI